MTLIKINTGISCVPTSDDEGCLVVMSLLFCWVGVKLLSTSMGKQSGPVVKRVYM
jgi:hypothetical protein